MKQRCTVAVEDQQYGGTCPNDARATCVIGARIEHACAEHLGLLAAEHGRALSVLPLGVPAPSTDDWESGRE